MKKTIIALFFLGSFVIANAQSTVFKPFKFDFSTGYAIPGGSGAKGGLIFAGEPKYAINDNINLGLRGEGALMGRSTINENGTTGDVEIKASASYLLTGDYYFNTNQFRPFGGIGAGMYRTAAASTNTIDPNAPNGNVEAGNKFGGIARIGFEYGHFRMAAEYNLVGKTGSFSNNYVGIKLGFFAGGGRIK